MYRYVPDGIKVAPKEIYHGYVARIRRHYTLYIVSIPRGIIKALGLNDRDLVEIVIRKITEEEAMKEYGYVPKGKVNPIIVTCPVCGQQGRVSVKASKKGVSVKVVHGKGRSRVYHYISKYMFPEEYCLFLKAYVERLKKYISTERLERIEKELRRTMEKLGMI